MMSYKGSTATPGTYALAVTFTIVFVLLKLIGTVDLHWVMVFMPLLVVLATPGLIFAVRFVFRHRQRIIPGRPFQSKR